MDIEFNFINEEEFEDNLTNALAEEIKAEIDKEIFEDIRSTTEPAQFRRTTIPLVRRIYPQLIANQMIGVQPLTQPASLLFYLRHIYAGQKYNNSSYKPLPLDWRKEGF